MSRKLFICIIMSFMLIIFTYTFIENASIEYRFQKEAYRMYFAAEQVAKFSDMYFEESGRWPVSVNELKEMYPHFLEVFRGNDDYSAIKYHPYSTNLGYGSVKFDCMPMVKAQSKLCLYRQQLIIRFPLNANEEWNGEFKLCNRRL